MKEFEVRMWAYSKTCRDYGIGKIVNITENGQGFKGDLIDIQYKYSKHAIENQDVVASYNIIDLIEVGDYVNGNKVIDIVENDVYVSNFYEEQCIGQVSKKNIKSIVTKEQFENMTYEVEE